MSRQQKDELQRRERLRYHRDPEFRGRRIRSVRHHQIIRPLALKARNAVVHRVQSGKLSPASAFACVDCGAPAKDYDHRDYTKPLEVEPVCHPCNINRGPGYPYNQ